MAYASIHLDTRRQKKNKCYPVKLRLYHNGDKKLYPLEMDLTKEEFEKSYHSLKPKGIHADIRKKLMEKENEAKKVIEKLQSFSFGQFERKMFKGLAYGKDVYSYFDTIIEDLKKKGRIGNMTNYQCAKNSFYSYTNKLSFSDVTPEFLHDYEAWMLENKKSLTSVGIYTRTLKAVYNYAIELGDVSRDLYPFGKRKYVVPAPRKVKKAFTEDELRKIFNYSVPKGSFLEKARDFFMFSYGLNGMNIKDIANLKWTNVDMKAKKLTFIREKTKNTTRGDQETELKEITDEILPIIEKYGNRDNEYVFDIYNSSMNAMQKFRAASVFTRFINQHMKTICKAAIGRDDVSTYWARHSSATILIRAGYSMEEVGATLGHKNIKTTQGYFAGFSDDLKKEMTKRLFSNIANS